MYVVKNDDEAVALANDSLRPGWGGIQPEYRAREENGVAD
jgi:hypothetical protein